jgi:hypothetical protein
MKLRITVGSEQKINGYINIDPVSQFDDLQADLRNLDLVADDAECSEILAEEVIDFVHREEVYPLLGLENLGMAEKYSYHSMTQDR